MAWEPRIDSASTVHWVPCFAPAPLCVGFYGFELFATVPRGLPPQPVKVPGTATRPGCPVQVATTMCKCSRVFLSVARLPGFIAVPCIPWTTNSPPRGNYGPGTMWAPCTGAPATTDFFCGFPGCSPRHRAGNNPAKPRQHERIVHGLYNPPRPRFLSRLRPSHFAPAPAVAYNQPGPGCSRIHPAKCVFQCGFAVGMVHLRPTRGTTCQPRGNHTRPRVVHCHGPQQGTHNSFCKLSHNPGRVSAVGVCGLVSCQGACPPRLPGATTTERGAGLSRVWPLFCVVPILYDRCHGL